jgi:hypothetical protein
VRKFIAYPAWSIVTNRPADGSFFYGMCERTLGLIRLRRDRQDSLRGLARKRAHKRRIAAMDVWASPPLGFILFAGLGGVGFLELLRCAFLENQTDPLRCLLLSIAPAGPGHHVAKLLFKSCVPGSARRLLNSSISSATL